MRKIALAVSLTLFAVGLYAAWRSPHFDPFSVGAILCLAVAAALYAEARR